MRGGGRATRPVHFANTWRRRRCGDEFVEFPNVKLHVSALCIEPATAGSPPDLVGVHPRVLVLSAPVFQDS